MMKSKINESTQHFAVIGNPVKHSLSPQIHQLFAKQFAINLSYQTLESDILDFEKTVWKFFETGMGLNVTVPFKLRAYILADSHDNWSEVAGAANTLTHQNGQIHAYNTDGIGLLADFDKHQIDLTNQNILIIGAGGATRGILMPLVSKNPKSITVCNRSEANAIELIREFNHQYDFKVCNFNQTEGHFDIIINATSLSLLNDVPAINCAIYQNAICYDLVYQLHEPTSFCRITQKYGAKLQLDGIGMLIEQAAQAFHIWHGQMPSTDGIAEKLKQTQLNNKS